MKKNLLSMYALACGTAILSCSCMIAPSPPMSPPPSTSLPPPRPNPISLQLPEVIYAVPGVEINVYFDNIVLVPNPDAYVFDVICAKGRNDAKRWRFLPKPEDVGEFKWKVSVYGLTGLVAQAETKIVVAKPDAGKGRKLSVLIVGDSLTNAGVYPARVFELMSGDDNPAITMVGSNGPGYKPQPGGVAHEGWGGWAWKTFISKTKPHPKENPTPPNIPSRFLVVDDEGKGTIDLQNYFKLYNNGNPPDIVTFQLGVNDVFGANDDNLEARIDDILASADVLIAAFRQAAPYAIIGVGLVTPGAASQDAFGANYACGQTRWQYKKNQHRLNQAMLQKFGQSADPLLSLIPTHVNLDCENNFPKTTEPVNVGNEAQITRLSNGVHPAPAGYRQIGDTFYAWMKAQLGR